LPILEQGEECNEAYTNCAEGLFCEIYEGYDHTGSCEPESWIYEELEPGQSCSNSLSTYDLCKGEHFCIPVDLIDDRWVELQCRMPQSSGASCVRDYRSPRDPCSADEYCKAEGDGLREWGTCTPRRSIGESCDQDNSCIKGVSCDRLSHTCVVPGLNRPGEICEENSDCYSRQCDWETKTCEYLVDC
jgi:hypothetical protein